MIWDVRAENAEIKHDLHDVPQGWLLTSRISEHFAAK
jgi:hypothetical protein